MPSEAIISRYGATSPFAELYKMLGTNVRWRDGEGGVSVLAVTGARPGQGSSTTAANLAIAVAESGERVVLIDADLRRPTIHTLLGLQAKVGFSDVLSREVPLESVLVQATPSTLWVLPAGAPQRNPTALLASPRLRTVLGALRERYDMVVIDTPAAGVFNDAAIIAGSTDGVVLVVSAGEAATRLDEEVVRRFQQAGITVLGAVLNRVPPEDSEGLSGYRQYLFERR